MKNYIYSIGIMFFAFISTPIVVVLVKEGFINPLFIIVSLFLSGIVIGYLSDKENN